jgi:hypothetical protein
MGMNDEHTPIERCHFRPVDGYESIAEMSLGTGNPGAHEVEGRLFEAIDDAGLRAVVRNGPIDPPDPDDLPSANVLVDPVEPEDQTDPTVLNPDAR